MNDARADARAEALIAFHSLRRENDNMKSTIAALQKKKDDDERLTRGGRLWLVAACLGGIGTIWIDWRVGLTIFLGLIVAQALGRIVFDIVNARKRISAQDPDHCPSGCHAFDRREGA